MSDPKVKAARCQTAGIISVVTGGAMAIFAAFVPMIYQNGIENKAITGNEMTNSTYGGKWGAIPGTFNIGVTWSHNMFTVSNIWDVSFVFFYLSLGRVHEQQTDFRAGRTFCLR